MRFMMTATVPALAAAAIGDCVITVPPNPLTAQGLATPYISDANCNMMDNPSFVQGVIFDPATNAISIYNPLVINVGTQPLVMPTAPNIPANAVVALWFGSNGNTLTLTAANQNTLINANCVNGIIAGQSATVFGQVAYCNAAQFWANPQIIAAIDNNALVPPIPPLLNDLNGNQCPTIRTFAVVDQDPSDNVVTAYLFLNGATAQKTAANVAALPAATELDNSSDNRLLAVVLAKGLGCQPYMAPDLADNNNPVAALPLSEIQARAQGPFPSATVPLQDPMTTDNGAINIPKWQAYRAGMLQGAAADAQEGNPLRFCQGFTQAGPPVLNTWKNLLTGLTTPDAAVGIDLYTFLGARMMNSWNNLNCGPLMTAAAQAQANAQNPQNPVMVAVVQNPVACTMNAMGVATACTFPALLALTPLQIVLISIASVVVIALIIFVVITCLQRRKIRDLDSKAMYQPIVEDVPKKQKPALTDISVSDSSVQESTDYYTSYDSYDDRGRKGRR